MAINESPGWNSVHVRVVTTSSVLGMIGSRCCSPSLCPCASAMMRHITSPSVSVDVLTGKVTAPVLIFSFLVSVFTTFSVAASSSVIVTVVFRDLAERLATVALMFALSS